MRQKEMCRGYTKHLFVVVRLGVLFFLFNVPSAYAADNGMFLCRSPVVANDFWNDLLAAQQTGIKLNRELAASIAKKHECKFVVSNNLKPIDYVANELAITDGNTKGWADPHLYIMYVNRPDNDPQHGK